MDTSHLTVVPAYGRDYKSAKAVKDDWDKDLDFQIMTVGPDDGRYINKADAKGLKIHARYAKLTKMVVLQ